MTFHQYPSIDATVFLGTRNPSWSASVMPPSWQPRVEFLARVSAMSTHLRLMWRLPNTFGGVVNAPIKYYKRCVYVHRRRPLQESEQTVKYRNKSITHNESKGITMFWLNSNFRATYQQTVVLLFLICSPPRVKNTLTVHCCWCNPSSYTFSWT